MAIHLRRLFSGSVLGSVALLTSCGDSQPSPSTSPTSDPPAAASLSAMTPVAAAIQLGATPLAVDETGTPTLLRGGAATPRMPADDATRAALMHVARLAPAWGVSAAAIPSLEPRGE